MAAPKEVTMKNISGRWVMNKTLTPTLTDVLAAQSIGWILRNAISLATLTLNINHYVDGDGKEHIDIDQLLTGNLKGTTENRTLDWQERPHEDYVFGKCVGKSRRIKSLDELDDNFLKGEWLDDESEHGWVHSVVVSDDYGWRVELVWGFAMVDVQGKMERRFVRRLKFTKEDEKLRLDKVMVYDWA